LLNKDNLLFWGFNLKLENMATPTCPKCTSTTFILQRITPQASMHQYDAICCAVCGAIAGIVDYPKDPIILNQIAQKLGV